MTKHFRTLVTSAAVVGLSLLTGGFAQAQTQTQGLSSEQIESVVSDMMQEPVSLFLGLPVDYTALSVTPDEGSATDFDVVFQGANISGLPLGSLAFDAEVKASGALELKIDLAPLLSGVAAMLNTSFRSEIFRVSMTVNTDARAIERVRFTIDDLFAGLAGAAEGNYLTLDGVIFTYDERAEDPRVTLDLGFDNLALVSGGSEIITLETIGASSELINIPEWYLHTEINHAIKQFFMASAGVITPTDAIANVIDSLVPLFEGEMVSLEGSLDMGKLVLNDSSLLDIDGRIEFDGLSLLSQYDHEQQTDNTDAEIGGLVYMIDGFPPGSEFPLLSFDGGTITGRTILSADHDFKPIGALLSVLSAQVRGSDVSALEDPTAAALDLNLLAAGPLLQWYMGAVERSDLAIELGEIAINFPGSPDEQLTFILGGTEFSSELAINGDSDLQRLAARVLDVDVVLPGSLIFQAGEISASYQINDSLAVIRDVLLGSIQDGLTLGDGIRLALALYLPDLAVGVEDVYVSGVTPTEMGAYEAYLASADISLSNHDMKTDQARISQLIAFSGLAANFDDRLMFDPMLVDLVLGADGPGLMPTDAVLQVDVTDIPMAMILAIADDVMLPPTDTLLSPDFDPSTLVMASAALLPRLFASPPSVVIEPSSVTGGMVELTASGQVDINPLMPPNYSVGSVIIRVTGALETQAEISRLVEEIATSGGSDYPDTFETLQQVLGGLAIVGGFGIPADDGALEFIIDIPAGEPASVNGLPIPLPF